MATAGPNFCGTGANFNDGGNIAWTNPTNVQGDTTTTAATVSPAANGNTSQRLRASNFALSVPAGSTINGVTVEVEQQAGNANRHAWSSVRLLIGGTESGNDDSDASSIPTSKGFKTFGSATDLWGLTPTVAQITASGFGVSLKVVRTSSQATTTSLFRVRITVDYTTISGAASITGAGVLSATGNVVSGAATVTGAADLAGVGSASATGTRITAGAAAFAGAGAVSATGTRVGIGAAALAGSGALAADGAVVPAGGGWGAPQNLVATPISTSQIDLSWDAVTGASGYDIERDGAVIVQDHAGTTYSDTERVASTLYTYRVRAVA